MPTGDRGHTLFRGLPNKNRGRGNSPSTFGLSFTTALVFVVGAAARILLGQHPF
ncbi:hypothetical protein H4V99_000500 [Cryobacterium sp. CG_9.6]|nr:hypothetical protein [Cryobacterium sp. CG_9.6]